MLKFKRIKALLLALILSLSLTACSEEVTGAIVDEVIDIAVSEVVDVLTEESGETADAESPPAQEESSAPAEEEPAPEEAAPEEVPAIDEDGSYTTKEDVALYIHTYGHLPDNFITKKEAEALGWSGGGLDDYAYGKSIGGDRFGNYEELLPDAEGRFWTECDINTLHAKSRGAKRIVFSNDGLIYYTDDHYESFELLYGEP